MRKMSRGFLKKVATILLQNEKNGGEKSPPPCMIAYLSAKRYNAPERLYLHFHNITTLDQNPYFTRLFGIFENLT